MEQITINPRFLTYDKDKVQQILDSVAHIDDTPTPGSNYPVKSGAVAAAITQAIAAMTEALAQYTTTEQLNELLAAKQDAIPMADEQDVRAIVTAYDPDGEPETEPATEP